MSLLVVTTSKYVAPVSVQLTKSRTVKIDRDRKFVKSRTKRFGRDLARFFKAHRKEMAEDILRLLGKADVSLVERIMNSLALNSWKEKVPDIARPYLSAVAVDGGELTSKQLGIFSDDILSLMRVRAREWADSRAAALVGRRVVDGALVESTTRWAITDSTRDLLRDTVMRGLEQGLSPAELAAQIESSYAMSASRAMNIARTEMAMADVAGSMESYRATPGVVGKRWLTAGDDKVSDECLSCEEVGAIALDAAFPTGADAPPNHPNCRCAIEPVFEDEMEN